MKKKTQRLIVILVLAALLISILVPALSMLGSAITQDDINSIKTELAGISAQKKEVESQLASIRNDLSKAREAVELVQSQVVLTESQINASQALLDEYDGLIFDKEQEILLLEAREVEQYQEFCAQVRWMEERGNVSYLSILFQASSFSEMLDYATLIVDIMEYSNRIIDQLEATQAELGEARDELQADRDAQAEVQAQLEQQKAELEVRRAEATALMNQIAASESTYAAQAAQLAASEAQVAKELKEAEQKYAAQIAALNNQNNATTGSWYWPLPGIYKLSSLFGPRPDPKTGKPDNHTGTDIPAARGTEIHAAKDGVVTTVATNTSSTYGYYCIINHGNGYVTLYAHMNSQAIVKVGDTVTKGQVIGYVGTTGRSTGYHLHFELRVNGVRGDVLKLYPGMTFTSPSGGTIKGG